MAKNTDISLRNSIMYSIYVRNHGPHGTFKDVEADLDRVKSLGTDIIWLMPIHPIGVKSKKGSLGCPYAISNYREVNPEYGTIEEFKQLIDRIHSKGMKCIIDVVYNHTSPDSWLVENHPEYFYNTPMGTMGNKVGDWTDIVDLDYTNKELWDYQIESLKYWVSIGVDGFRCDVASIIPVEFWLRAREEVAKVNKDTIWLAESVHPGFLMDMRKNGFVGHSDSEVYQAFDMTYDYDVNDEYVAYLKGETSLKEYVRRLQMQEFVYPDNYIKLRFLENHDQPRAKKLIPDDAKLNIWTGFLYLQKGCTLLYAGQEAMETKTPNLFDVDKVNWSGAEEDFTTLLKKLAGIKKMKIMSRGHYEIKTADKKDVILASYEYQEKKLVGIFNVGLEEGIIVASLPDGEYTDLLSEEVYTVIDSKIRLTDKPVVLYTRG